MKNKIKKEERKRILLNVIKKKKYLNKTQLINFTKLRSGTVLDLIEELKKEGFLKIKNEKSGKVGRPGELLEINPKNKLALGVTITKNFIFLVVIDLSGKIIFKNKIENILKEGKEKTISKVILSLQKTFSLYPKEKFLGIGLSLPGLIDTKRGIALFSTYADWWKDIPFKRILKKEFSLPVEIENDTRCSSIFEQLEGEAKNKRNFIYIEINEGVGSSIILDKKIYRGTKERAGEFGHMTIDPNGPLCKCGNYGCLESLISLENIYQKIKKTVDSGIHTKIIDLTNGNLDKTTPEILIKAAEKGDKVALNIIENIGINLGIGISNLINLLNPQTIILSGEFTSAKDLLLQPIVNTVKKRALEDLWKKTEIKFSRKYHHYSSAKGAALLILQKFFQEQ